MDNFFNGLRDLILTVRKNFWAALATTLMLILLILVWSARGNFAAWLAQHPSAEVQAQRAIRSIASEKKINAALNKDRQYVNADRIQIRQFHEMIDPKSRIVVPSATVTYIVTAPGVALPPAVSAPVPRAYLSDVMELVWEDENNPVCTVQNITDIKDEVWHARLVASGVAVLYSCPILDIDGLPIGMIHATYLTATKSRPRNEEIFQKLSMTAIKVAGYLAEVTAPESDSWFLKILKM